MSQASSTDIVNAAFEEGMTLAKALDTAVQQLRGVREPRRQVWTERLQNIMKHELPVTKIGFYGVTGAGKSSVINSIVDASLVTTSSYGAGTAVVTEIHYHKNDNYVAEVKFVNEETWKSTLSALLDAVKEKDSGSSRETLGHGNEDVLNVAWSQVQTVYPSLDRHHLNRMTVEDITSSNEAVETILGTTKTIVAKDIKTFERDIAAFIGANSSRSNRAPRFKSERQNISRAVATSAVLWPLIDRIQIHCNARVLSAGVVLVDLPGTSDTNYARSQIAEQNLRYCDKIWILAPISRAISDKLAKDLLGESFKRQMQMDGSYNSKTLTFIATKTDDISCEDIIQQLSLEHEPVLLRIEDDIEAYCAQMRIHNDALIQIERDMEDIDNETNVSNEESNRQAEHPREMVQNAGLKRPRQATDSPQAPKRIKSEPVNDGQSAFSDPEPIQPTRDAESKKIKDQIAFNERKLRELRARKSEIERQLMSAKMKKQEAEKSKQAFCSLARSQDGCISLKDDFRQGLIDIDYIAADDRSHEDLPVFCTSATDYGKLHGFLRRNGDPVCFSDIKDTGIPALRSWCAALAAPSRERAARQMFTMLEALAQSVLHYVEGASQNDDIGRAELKAKWSSTYNRVETGIVEYRLTKEISELVDASVGKLKSEWTDILQSGCARGVASACASAPTICEDFLDFKKLNHQTVRAILRYHGNFVFHRDLNELLTRPLLDGLMSVWTDFFQTAFFDSLVTSVRAVVENLLKEIKNDTSANLHEVFDKLAARCLQDVHSAMLTNISSARSRIDEQKKRLSRTVAQQCIQEGFRESYERATQLDVHGAGSMVMRKATFIGYIKENSEKIFHNASEKILTDIFLMLGSVATDLKSSLKFLARDVEVNISTLWETLRGDVSDIRARAQVLKSVEQVSEQVIFWQEKMRETFCTKQERSPSMLPAPKME